MPIFSKLHTVFTSVLKGQEALKSMSYILWWDQIKGICKNVAPVLTEVISPSRHALWEIQDGKSLGLLVSILGEKIGLDSFHEAVKPLCHCPLLVWCLLTDDLLPQLPKILMHKGRNIIVNWDIFSINNEQYDWIMLRENESVTYEYASLND